MLGAGGISSGTHYQRCIFIDGGIDSGYERKQLLSISHDTYFLSIMASSISETRFPEDKPWS